MLNSKGKKTTIVAILISLMAISLFVALFMKIIDSDQLFKGLNGLGVFGAVLIGWLSKDQDATHSK